MRVNINKRTIGINFIASGEAEIVVWSPAAKSIEIFTETNKKISLTNNDLGYWSSVTDLIVPGSQYKIAIDGKGFHGYQ